MIHGLPYGAAIRRPLLIGLGCLTAAALSALVIAPAPSYDPWAWLLWGREIAEGTLSTDEGPAFKPLPVAVCALLAPLGDAAPVVWVILARAGAVAAVVLAFVLARSLAAGGRDVRDVRARTARASTVAGLLAAVGVALCGAFPRYAATGDVTGLLLAFVFGGALAWRAGRAGTAIACAAGAALLRVETWPFLLAGAIVLWRRDPARRPVLAAGAVAIGAAWFVPEWLGSGDLLRSGARARVPNPGQPALADVPALASLGDAVALPLWPLLAAAAAAGIAVATGAATGRRPAAAGARPVLAPAAAGVAWIALVAAMAQAGFSGEARYALPGAALLALAGAVALARLPRAALAAVAVLVVAAAVPRLAGLDDLRAGQAHQWRLASDLRRAVDAAGGRDAVLRCGTPYVGRYRGPLMAYRLHVAKRTVEPDAPPQPPGVVFRSRLDAGAPLAPAAGGFPLLRRAGAWEVRARCASRAGGGAPPG